MSSSGGRTQAIAQTNRGYFRGASLMGPLSSRINVKINKKSLILYHLLKKKQTGKEKT